LLRNGLVLRVAAKIPSTKISEQHKTKLEAYRDANWGYKKIRDKFGLKSETMDK
jgi:hypothetical protein